MPRYRYLIRQVYSTSQGYNFDLQIMRQKKFLFFWFNDEVICVVSTNLLEPAYIDAEKIIASDIYLQRQGAKVRGSRVYYPEQFKIENDLTK